MDPVTAKGLGGLGGLGGQLGKTGNRPLGKAGKFEGLRADKLKGKKFDPAKLAQNFMKTGRMEGVHKPTMSERVAMRDGISFPGATTGPQGAEQAWRPNAVQATGKAESLTGAVKQLNSGQHRLESILGELRSGKKFDQSQLIGMQAEVNVLSQQMQFTTKLVSAAMQSLKQVMQQQA